MSATVRFAAAISLAVLGTTSGAISFGTLGSVLWADASVLWADASVLCADEQSSDSAPAEPEDERESDDSSLEDDSFEEDSFEDAVLCRDDRAQHAAFAIALVLIDHAQACGRSADGRLERPPRI